LSIQSLAIHISFVQLFISLKFVYAFGT
jgi:hypothetical protein